MRIPGIFLLYIGISIPSGVAGSLTAGEVIGRIQKQVGVSWRAETVDTIKAGSDATEVTGIATTFGANLDVIQRAVAAGQNMIITHEPTFYSHQDTTKELESDAVYLQKKKFIEDHHVVVFRFHDHWHMRRPDGILKGMTAALGWEKFQRTDEPALYTVPSTSLADLAKTLRTRLGIHTMRVVGDRNLHATRVAFLPGAGGPAGQIKMLERNDVEVLLIGETSEWTTVEYVRDAVTEGKKKALIILGHLPSEQAGMDECAKWLRTFIKEIPVAYVPGVEPFWSPE